MLGVEEVGRRLLEWCSNKPQLFHAALVRNKLESNIVGDEKEVANVNCQSVVMQTLLLILLVGGCTKEPDKTKRASELRLKANEALAKNDFESTIKNTTEALELEPDHVDALWMRGLARLKTKDYDKAEEDLSRAIKLDTQYAPAYRERGSVRLAQGKYKEAVEDATTFLKLRPGDEDGLRIRILANEKLGNKVAVDMDLQELDKMKKK